MPAEDYIDMNYALVNAPDMPRNHGKPWTPSLDDSLLRRWRGNSSMQAMAIEFGRTRGSISSRLSVLGVPCDEMGNPMAYDGSNCPMTKTKTSPSTEVKENIMNVKITHLITLLQKDFTTIEVRFNKADAKTYTYKAHFSMGIVENDRVVVEASGEWKVCRVVAVHAEPELDFEKPYALKWVVQKVDATAYEEQQVREAAAMSMIHKAEQAKKQQEALDALLGTGTSREQLLALLNGA